MQKRTGRRDKKRRPGLRFTTEAPTEIGPAAPMRQARSTGRSAAKGVFPLVVDTLIIGS
ncbi:hypothetical protein GCM10010493_35300 [Streptomyces lavendulae subsp. grasserius]